MTSEPPNYLRNSLLALFPNRTSLRRVRFSTSTKSSPNSRFKVWLAQHRPPREVSWRAQSSNPDVYPQGTPGQHTWQQAPGWYYIPVISDANLCMPSCPEPAPLQGTPHVQLFGYSSYTPTRGTVVRQRPPSWHGTPTGRLSQPYIPTNQRHSIGLNIYPVLQCATWLQLQSGPPSPHSYYTQPIQINPWINADAPKSDFLFDLASPAFSPLQISTNGFSVPLAPSQLNQLATYPPLTRLRIVCDTIAEWPIDLEFQVSPDGGYNSGYHVTPPPPIRLVDVLVAVHRALHLQMTHVDWSILSSDQKREVRRTYTRRCGAMRGMGGHEVIGGVKKIDFLLQRTRMVGLLNGGSVDGWDVMKLVVAEM